MKLTILYDDEKADEPNLQSDHGFSIYIETDQEVVLFDTGTKGHILLQNMKQLHKDPKKISHIVISHNHYDHNGGLSELLNHCGPVTIYQIGTNQSTELVQNITVKEPLHITKHIWSTGRLPGHPLDEQSLILQTSKGLWVLTGCSHSGIKQILNQAKKKGQVIGLIGGFHGFNDFTMLKDLTNIYPCHCTVQKQQIKQHYPEKTHPCKVGTTIDLESISS